MIVVSPPGISPQKTSLAHNQLAYRRWLKVDEKEWSPSPTCLLSVLSTAGLEDGSISSCARGESPLALFFGEIYVPGLRFLERSKLVFRPSRAALSPPPSWNRRDLAMVARFVAPGWAWILWARSTGPRRLIKHQNLPATQWERYCSSPSSQAFLQITGFSLLAESELPDSLRITLCWIYQARKHDCLHRVAKAWDIDLPMLFICTGPRSSQPTATNP